MTELTEIRIKIEKQDWSDFTLRTDEEAVSQKIELNFTADDVSKLERQINELMKSLPECLHSLIDELALKVKGDLDAKWAEEEQRREAELAGFRNRLEDRWRTPLSRLRQLIVISTETGDGINQRLRKQAPRRRSPTGADPATCAGLPDRERGRSAADFWICRWRNGPLADAPRNCRYLRLHRQGRGPGGEVPAL
jgi:hypothetical protein